MKRVLSLLALVAAVAAAGCTDTLTEPGGSAIVGSWKASKIGAVFAAGTTMDAVFKSDGGFTTTISGQTWTGTYTTSGSSATADIRNITITVSTPVGMTLAGIYQINGSQMKLEVIPSPTPANTTAPDATTGIGSTTVNGTATNVYVTEMQKQ